MKRLSKNGVYDVYINDILNTANNQARMKGVEKIPLNFRARRHNLLINQVAANKLPGIFFQNSHEDNNLNKNCEAKRQTKTFKKVKSFFK